MAWTKLTKTTTKALIGQLGEKWDSCFSFDDRAFWVNTWRSTRRRVLMKKIEASLGVLQKSRDEKTACAFFDNAHAISQDAYRLQGNSPLGRQYSKSKAAKPGVDEILALLGAPFVDGVYAHKTSSLLRIITAPVEIQHNTIVYPMGQYCLLLDFKGVPTHITNMRIEPHRTRDYNGCHHQHVHTYGDYCGGEAEGPMRKLFGKGLLYEAVAFVFHYLQSPSGHGFCALGYFAPDGSASARPICGHCHYKPAKASALRHCKYCKIALCEKCSAGKVCKFCGKKLPCRKAVRKVKSNAAKPGLKPRQRRSRARARTYTMSQVIDEFSMPTRF